MIGNLTRLVKPTCTPYYGAMNPQELVRKYGSQTAVARAFGVTRSAVQQWVKAAQVPRARLWQAKAGLVKPPQGLYAGRKSASQGGGIGGV